MERKRLVTLHMYLAAFFAPAILLVAISGGLYLLGIKGEVKQEAVYTSSEITIDSSSASLKSDVSALLAKAGAESFDFETVKVKGATLYTRPTSKNHYIIQTSAEGVEVIFAQPDLQGRMIELHKGHGPAAFKTFQKAVALALIAIILSGLWLGLSTSRLRLTTSLTAAVGAAVFALLILI